MMKPDADIDTEKYSSHNIHNNMFIKTFYVPDDIKKDSMSPAAVINFIAVDYDAAPSPEMDENQHTRFAQHNGPPCHGDFMAVDYDAAPSPGDERKPAQTVCAAYRFPMPWGFIADRNAIRHRKGVMGQWVDKKISYYTFPLANCKSPSLSCTLPPFK